jgi:hypothetical protein
MLAPLALVLVALGLPHAQPSDAAQLRPATLVEFARGDGFWSDQELTVLANGRATVSWGHRGPAGLERGSRKVVLSGSTMRQLRAALRAADFRTLHPRYVGPGADFVGYRIAHSGFVVYTDEVALAQGLPPKRLARLVSFLNRLLDSRLP